MGAKHILGSFGTKKQGGLYYEIVRKSSRRSAGGSNGCFMMTACGGGAGGGNGGNGGNGGKGGDTEIVELVPRSGYNGPGIRAVRLAALRLSPRRQKSRM